MKIKFNFIYLQNLIKNSLKKIPWMLSELNKLKPLTLNTIMILNQENFIKMVMLI